ncbi:GtrA family protein [Pedobacter petrophilus]|uniref:GtrA family protein n=1 Tax=Pedobacter petrophilus TaxID=1908241 RepID=A0A7K0G4G8_9SPHI|nr:GtrA family protein [Pedobacter petrophilus]MRX78532.1 GtrA family protein [Pedobacter petrophilus]
MSKKKSIGIFLKAQVSAFSGGITDYGLMILFTEIIGIHFAISILLSGTLGGIVNFCLNRFWAFNDGKEYAASPKKQLMKFATVVLGSISLKSAGTYLLQQGFDLDYRLGRLLVDSVVSYGFNYPMMKLWVFKTQANDTENSDEEERGVLPAHS